MIKRIIPIILYVILVFGISVSATNISEATPAENSQLTEEIPQRDNRPQTGVRGNMGNPYDIQGGEMPPDFREGMNPPEMPNGEMPREDNMPSRMNGQAGAVNPEQNIQKTSENKLQIFVKTNSTPIISVVLLILAFIFVVFYKRKSY